MQDYFIEMIVFNLITLYIVTSLYDLVKAYMLTMQVDNKFSMYKHFIERNTQSLVLSWLGALVTTCLINIIDIFL